MAVRDVGIRLVAEDEAKFNRALDQADDKILAFGDAATRAASQLDRAASSTNAASKAVTAAGTAAEASSQHFAKVESGVNAASSAFGALALPVAAAGVASIKLATDFDSSLRNINSIAGLSEDQLGKLGQQFIDLSLDGSKTFESASALATGFYDIQSSGFAGADGMKVLEASTKAASAGMSTTQTAANAISATLNAYGQSADDASKVSDVLFQTVNLGVVNFEELSSSIGRVIPTAASAKVSIEEVGAAISTMTKSGLAGAQAVTDLNSLISNVIKPSQQAADAAKNMGLDFSFAALQSKGLAGFMADVMKATNGDAAAMGQLFGSQEALTAALSITKGEMKGFLSDLDGMQHAAGATDRAFQEMSKSTAAQFKRLQANFSALGVTVGSELLPRVNDAVAGLNNLVKAFTQLPKDEQQRWIDIAVHVGEGTIALYGATKALQGIITVAKGAATAFEGISAAAALVGGAPIVAGVVGLGAAVAAVALGAEQARDHYREMADAASSADPVLRAARDAIYGKESGGGGSSWAIDFVNDADRAKQEAADLKARLAELTDTYLTQEGQVIALTNAGPAYTGRLQEATAAAAATEQEIAALTARTNEYDAAQAAVAAHADALSTAHQRYASSINNTGSALQTLSQASSQGASAIATTTAAVTLSEKEWQALEKTIRTAADTAIGDFQKMIDASASFEKSQEDATSTHWARIADIEKGWADARTNAQKQAVQEKLDAENKGYAQQQQDAAVAYASQAAAQKAALGAQLIDYVTALATKNGITGEKLAELTGKIATEYGIQKSISQTTFEAFKTDADNWAAGTGVSADKVISDLHMSTAAAENLRQAEDKMTGVFVSQLNQNFPEGTRDSQEYLDKLAAIPAEVHTILTSNFYEQTLLIQGVTAAMNSIPQSKAIRIAAGIDPELMHHSPSPIEQEMALIDEFASRAHIFKLGISGNLDAMASYAGANDPLSYLGPTTKTLDQIGTAYTANGATIGMQFMEGMQIGVLRTMPALWAAMRASTNSGIQELVSFIQQGDNGPLTAAGAALVNQLASGMQQVAPAFREMPAWVAYTKDLGDGLTLLGSRADWMAGAAKDGKDLGNGLRLLGDQTPVVQNLGNGLSLLGDQWARQAATMTDLAPKLPALADGFAAVGASVVHATDDILTHATYGKSSGMAFGYLNDGIQRVGEMTKITAGVISDVAPHWGESWKVMGDATVAALDRADQFAFGASKNILGYIDHAIQRIDDLIAEIGKIPGIHVNTAAATPFSTGALPGRALGGPVTAGVPYVVGERGRELFVPQVSGTVLPASLTQRIAPPASAQQIANSYSYSTTTHGPTLNYQPTYVQPARGVAQDFAIARALIGTW